MWEFIFGLVCGGSLGALVAFAAVYGWEKHPFEEPGSVAYYQRIYKLHQRNYYSHLRGGYRSSAVSDKVDMEAAKRDLDAAIKRDAEKQDPSLKNWGGEL